MILNTWSISAGNFSQIEGYNGYSSKSEIPNVLSRCSALVLSALSLLFIPRKFIEVETFLLLFWMHSLCSFIDLDYLYCSSSFGLLTLVQVILFLKQKQILKTSHPGESKKKKILLFNYVTKFYCCYCRESELSTPKCISLPFLDYF